MSYKRFDEMEQDFIKQEFRIDLKDINLEKEISIFEICTYRLMNKIEIFGSTVEKSNYKYEKNDFIKLIPIRSDFGKIETFIENDSVNFFLKIKCKGMIKFNNFFYMYDLSNYTNDLYLVHSLRVKLERIKNSTMITEDIFEIIENDKKNILNFFSNDNNKFFLKDSVDKISYVFHNFGNEKKNFSNLEYLILKNKNENMLFKNIKNGTLLEEEINKEVLKYPKILFLNLSKERVIIEEKNKIKLIKLNCYELFLADEFVCLLGNFFVLKKKRKCIIVNIDGKELEAGYSFESLDIKYSKKIYKLKNFNTKKKKLIIFDDKFIRYKCLDYRELAVDLFVMNNNIFNETDKSLSFKLQSNKSAKVQNFKEDSRLNFYDFKVIEVSYKTKRKKINIFDNIESDTTEIYTKRFYLEMYDKNIIELPIPEKRENLKNSTSKNIFFEIARAGDPTNFLFYIIYEYNYFSKLSDIKREIVIVKNRLFYYKDKTYELYKEKFYRDNIALDELKIYIKQDLNKWEEDLPKEIIEVIKKYLENK